MPIETPEDLAAFFSPDEFGVAIAYRGIEGFGAIWTRPTELLETPSGRFAADSNVFSVPVTRIPDPARGDAIVVMATGESFVVAGEPRRNRDGALWQLEVEPA